MTADGLSEVSVQERAPRVACPSAVDPPPSPGMTVAWHGRASAWPCHAQWLLILHGYLVSVSPAVVVAAAATPATTTIAAASTTPAAATEAAAALLLRPGLVNG